MTRTNRAEDDVIAERREIVREVGQGMVEIAMLRADKYEVVRRDDGWHAYVYEEQQAAWDQEHGLD